jgi:hypothetical protein
MSAIELARAVADASAVYFRRQMVAAPGFQPMLLNAPFTYLKYDDGELPPAPRVVHLQPRSTWK